MYQFILESLLGVGLDAGKLHVSPCRPSDWKSFQVPYRYRQTVYHVTVLQTSAADGAPGLTVDGAVLPCQAIPLVDVRREHSVEVRIPPAQS